MKRRSSKWEVLPLVQTLLRVGCGAALILASVDKLGDPAKFLKVIENYHGLPGDLLPLFAVVLPWLEFFTGSFLALGYQRRGSALIFCFLMGVYALALTWNLVNGVEMNCGCFAMDSTEKLTGWTVLRDLAFFTGGWIVLCADRTYAALKD
jgi:uncharacterized membrane protein YphA (DoxX/SURF4 family)